MNASSIFRVLAAGLVAGLATLGVTSPAQAATTSNVTVTSTGALTAGQPNAAPIVVTFTAPTAMPGNSNNSSQVRLNGATWVTAPTNFQCGGIVSVSANQGVSSNCVPSGTSEVYAQGMATNATDWAANTTWTVTFAANTVILPNAPVLQVVTSTFVAAQGGARYDSGTDIAAMTGYVAPSSTVTFDANGGVGTLSNQVAGSATPLTANAYNRSGFTFAGWNTAANGSGTAYADGASYPFTSSTTLYAQWTAVLANTGVDAAGYLASATLLFILGATLIAFRTMSRKKPHKS